MRELFFKHPLMKAVSLGLAVLLWAFVRGERRMEMSVDVPIHLKNLSEKYVITGDVEPTINLRMVGPKTRLGRIDRDSFPPYELDLGSTRRGFVTFAIHEEDFKIPHGVQITRIAPQTIRLNIDEADEKVVKVEPKFTDELDEGYERVGFDVTPSHIQVRGSRRELAQRAFVTTEPISLAGRHSSFKGEYSVPAREFGGTEEGGKVVVNVTIREREISRIFKDVPVKVTGLTISSRVEPKTVSLRVIGQAGQVAAVGRERLEVTIDAKKKLKSFRGRPTAPAYSGVEIVVIPDTVRVLIND